MRTVELNHKVESAKHLLAALSGETSKIAPKDYVEQLFDGYASNFENSLVKTLEYQTPKLITEMILVDNHSRSFGSVLDLGCGTGLLGEEIRKFCTTLEGVDLSGKMLDIAKTKDLYDRLVKQDILEYLASASLDFNYYIATDVFVYFGDLNDVFELIKCRNKSGGKLVFSTEHSERSSFFLEKSGRYSHPKTYIQSLCDKFSYKLSHFEIQNLRKEKSQNIIGGLYSLDF